MIEAYDEIPLCSELSMYRNFYLVLCGIRKSIRYGIVIKYLGIPKYLVLSLH